MAYKHQIKVSSKKGRTVAGRKWRRQAKLRMFKELAENKHITPRGR